MDSFAFPTFPPAKAEPGSAAWARERMVEADARLAEFSLGGDWNGNVIVVHNSCGEEVADVTTVAQAALAALEHICPT